MFELRPYNHRNNRIANNPWHELDEFEKNFFSNPFDFFESDAFGGFRTDIKDQGDSYLLEADLPGFDKKDIHLDLNGDTLSINAQRHSEHEEKDKKNKYIRCERSYGSYRRDFDVSMIDAQNIKAKYDNGVLKLTLPKKSETISDSKRLEIE